MGYQRTLPRDLFNEANLLKCLGRLWMLLKEYAPPGFQIAHDWPTAGFQIHQDPSDGSIYCSNIKIGNALTRWVVPFRPLNSRDQWPLFIADGDDEIEVFDSEGNLTDEFLEWGKRS